jgi:hypothetical protein
VSACNSPIVLNRLATVLTVVVCNNPDGEGTNVFVGIFRLMCKNGTAFKAGDSGLYNLVLRNVFPVCSNACLVVNNTPSGDVKNLLTRRVSRNTDTVGTDRLSFLIRLLIGHYLAKISCRCLGIFLQINLSTLPYVISLRCGSTHQPIVSEEPFAYYHRH